MAGKSITPQDLCLVFGSYFTERFSKPNNVLKPLLYWLRANQRNELNFRPANAMIIELALQRLYSLWPTLSIVAIPKADANSHSPTKTTPMTFQFSLQWDSRVQIHRDFHDPDQYSPNINRI